METPTHYAPIVQRTILVDVHGVVAGYSEPVLDVQAVCDAIAGLMARVAELEERMIMMGERMGEYEDKP